MEQPRLKFHGKFKDLRPNGFTFQKLFARNYRCYHHESQLGDTIWIWQHLGGYVEIEDLHHLSYIITNAIIDNIPWHNQNGQYAIDTQTNTVYPHNHLIHDPTFAICIGSGTDDEKKERHEQHNQRWTRGSLDQETIEYLKDMIRRGWINKQEYKHD